MAARKSKKSALDLLREAPDSNSRGGPGCLTCNTRWAPLIDEFIEEATRTHPKMGMRQLHRILKKSGYPCGQGALTQHLQNHRPQIWEAWHGRPKNPG
jgi:hypothetical protein